jgi:hypothetical protein
MSDSSERCGRCAATVNDPSWWCLHCGAALCDSCGDGVGHCGHPKVEEMNRTPLDANSHTERERLVAQLARIMRALAPDGQRLTPGPRDAQLLN